MRCPKCDTKTLFAKQIYCHNCGSYLPFPQDEAEETDEKIAGRPDVPKDYRKCKIKDMIKDFSSNPFSAKEKYLNQYIEITGRLNRIISSSQESYLEIIEWQKSWDSYSYSDDIFIFNIDNEEGVLKDKLMLLFKGQKIRAAGYFKRFDGDKHDNRRYYFDLTDILPSDVL